MSVPNWTPLFFFPINALEAICFLIDLTFGPVAEVPHISFLRSNLHRSYSLAR